MAVLNGGRGRDMLRGTEEADTISGFEGNDELLGLGGNDLVDGGQGDDLLEGGDGADTLLGGAGSDRLLGGAGRDVMTGGAAEDTIDGGAGTDVATYAIRSTDARTTQTGSASWTIAARGEGSDAVTNVERVQFADRMVYLVPNIVPVAAADSAALTEDAAVLTATGNLLHNDSDGDLDPIAITSVRLGSGPAATNGATGIGGAYGRLTWDAAGNYSYGLANASEAVDGLRAGQQVRDEFTYAIADGHGGTASAVLKIEVTGVNDAPRLAGPVTLTSAEDTPLTITAGQLLAGATDPENDPMSVIDLVVTSGGGSLVAAGTGWTYTPARDYAGPVTLSYKVHDGAASTLQTATLAIAGVNDAPTLTEAGLGIAAGSGGSTLITVSVRAQDPDGPALKARVDWGDGSAVEEVDLTASGGGLYTGRPARVLAADTYTVQVSVTDGDLESRTQSLNFTVWQSSRGGEQVGGTPGTDILLGTNGNDTLIGGPGSDDNDGDDIYRPGPGNDTMIEWNLQPPTGTCSTSRNLPAAASATTPSSTSMSESTGSTSSDIARPISLPSTGCSETAWRDSPSGLAVR